MKKEKLCMFFQRVQHRNLMYDNKKRKENTSLKKKLRLALTVLQNRVMMYIINKKNLKKKKIDSKFTLCESV